MKENEKENKFDPRSHIGETHGIYTIIDMLDEKDKYGHWIYVAQCNECGYKKQSHYGEISGIKSKTVKCRHLKASGDYIVYGHTWQNKRIGRIFNKMFRRCYNPDDKDYRWYGAKGIKICNKWLENPKLFEEWSFKNGYNDTLTIDRINECKDYSPDNCRFITYIENQNNKRTNTYIEFNNEINTITNWAKKLNINPRTLVTRLDTLNWSVEKALTTPVNKRVNNDDVHNPKR